MVAFVTLTKKPISSVEDSAKNSVYEVYGKYFKYNVVVTSNSAVPVKTSCHSLIVYGGDDYIISKYKDRVRNGNKVNQMDSNGRLILNIKLDNLTPNQKTLLTSTSTVTLGVKRAAELDKDGFYCGSFVDIVSVEPYVESI